MKEIVIALMNWWARPFPQINAVVLAIFMCCLFLSGVAIAVHPYVTELLSVLQAPKLQTALRILAFVFLSCYCTLGCLCRIIIQFWPEELSNEHRP